jgi:hypothetical protein
MDIKQLLIMFSTIAPGAVIQGPKEQLSTELWKKLCETSILAG